MKVLAPFYFDEFSCIGSKCSETCCTGWKIIIDNETYDKYQQIEGEFGIKLINSIAVDAKNQKVFTLNKEGSCPFLNSNHLCDIYINIGEELLCKTCMIYPRSLKIYGDIVERDLTLSCPEVARILVSNSESIDFCYGEYDGDKGEENEIDNDLLFNALIAGRGLSVDLMQIKEIPIWKRAYLCLVIADKMQKNIDKNEITLIQSSLEPFYKESYLNQYLEALNEFSDNNKLKLIQYEALLKIMQEMKFKNETFLKYLNETIEFFRSHNNAYMLDFIKEKTDTFDKYYSAKDYIYENYFVYHMFHYYMSSYKKRDPYKNIVMMIDTFALIKLFGIIRWFNNGYQITDDEQCEILYSYSRAIEHYEGCIDRIYDRIVELNLSNMAYLAAIIR